MEDVVRACRAAHIHEAIMQMPEGYQTVLTGDGSGLSKGQKQMLTIARAMLLDSQNADPGRSDFQCGYAARKKKFKLAMRELMKGKTCFVDRSPAVHDPKCRPHSRCPEWRHCRTGKPRYFAETGRSVFQTVLLPVPVTHLRQ